MLIYGGTAYAYVSDPDFMPVSTSTKFWQKVIDKFYEKYTGWAEWHIALMHEATTTGRLSMPTGRVYEFKPYLQERTGEMKWPRTTILNYPVQGLGADLMAIARVSFRRRFVSQAIRGVLVSSVHDSIVADVEDSSEVDRTIKIGFDVFNDIPTNFEKLFGTKFDLPMRVEAKVGKNLLDMTEVK